MVGGRDGGSVLFEINTGLWGGRRTERLGLRSRQAQGNGLWDVGL